MRIVEKPLTKASITQIRNKFGEYIKLTTDIDQEIIVVGCRLHADGEKLLLEKGSKQNNIWGGGIDLKNKIIDTAAVLNYRPNLENNSLEILDPIQREKFIKIIKNFFDELWK